MAETVVIARLRRDGGTQIRAGLNEEHVARCVEAIEAGDDLPPPVVFYDGENNWLADGFHRVAAWERTGRAVIGADVRQGTREDAIEYATDGRTNGTHGLPLAYADKKRAILATVALPRWQSAPQSAIARHCKVSQQYVSKVLTNEQVTTGCNLLSTTVVGTDGKEQPRARPRKSDPETDTILTEWTPEEPMPTRAPALESDPVESLTPRQRAARELDARVKALWESGVERHADIAREAGCALSTVGLSLSRQGLIKRGLHPVETIARRARETAADMCSYTTAPEVYRNGSDAEQREVCVDSLRALISASRKVINWLNNEAIGG